MSDPRDPPTSEDITGSFRREDLKDDPTQEIIGLAGRRVPLWWLLVSGLGVGSAGVGGGALDLFGISQLRAKVEQVASDLAELRADQVQTAHATEIAMMQCGCGSHGPIAPR